jgi:hypothetical protein
MFRFYSEEVRLPLANARKGEVVMVGAKIQKESVLDKFDFSD